MVSPQIIGVTEIKWSILDPDLPLGHQDKFRNFELPLTDSNLYTGLGEQGDLFCSGHVWTKHGSLFVSGGTLYHPDSPITLGLIGSKLTYLWDPRDWTTTATDNGWFKMDDLAAARWYPTCTG